MNNGGFNSVVQGARSILSRCGASVTEKGGDGLDASESGRAAGTDAGLPKGGWLFRWTGALVDGTLLALMKSTRRHPAGQDYERLQREIADAHALYERLGFLDDPASFHRPPTAIDDMSVRQRRFPGLKFSHLEFDSGYEPHPDDPAGQRWMSYSENRRVHAWMLRHEGRDRPWLVCPHGLGTGSPWIDFGAFGASVLHHGFGLNLLFPVLPLHGPRRPPNSERGAMISFELVETLHGVTQAVWDVRRLVRWAREQGATRIGLYGQSMGAYTAALVGGLEDVSLIVAAIPLSDIPDLFVWHTSRRARKKAMAYEILGERLNELFQLVSTSHFPPTAVKANRFIIAGTSDRITPPAQAIRLWEVWGRPAIRWFRGGHLSFFWSKAAKGYVSEALRKMSWSPLERVA